MSTSGFSIDALLAKDTADTDDVLLQSESSEDTRKRTTAPLTVDWLSYGLNDRSQSGALPLHRSYDSLGANSHLNNQRPECYSGFRNASGSGFASASDSFWNKTSDVWNNSSNVGQYNSSLDLERSRLNPFFVDTHLARIARLKHSTGVKGKEDEEVDEEVEEDRANLIRSSTGYVQREKTSTTSHISSNSTALQSTKPHAEGSAKQQPVLQNSTLSRPWEREKFVNSSLATSTPTSNAPIRRPWEVSPVYHIEPLDVSAYNHSYMGQTSQDSGYPSFGTQSMGQYDVPRSPDSAPIRDVSQDADDDSQDINHIDTKRVQKPKRSNTIFSDETVEVMETWYAANYNVPYPSDEQTDLLATRACITVRQARKWLANRRVRSHNTLAYNNNVHPKRARRLKKNRRAMLDLAASLSQNNIDVGDANILTVNVSSQLTPATTHGGINSINGGEISANILDPFPPRDTVVQVNRRSNRMDDISRFPRLSFSSGLSHSESDQAAFGYLQSPTVNVSLNPAITHGVINSMNGGRETLANIQDPFLPSGPAVQVNQIASQMDNYRFPGLSYSSGLSHSESDQVAFGYHQRPILNWSTSTQNSSLQHGLFHHQPQEQQRQQLMSSGDRSLPVFAAPPTYLPYNNYQDEKHRQ